MSMGIDRIHFAGGVRTTSRAAAVSLCAMILLLAGKSGDARSQSKQAPPPSAEDKESIRIRNMLRAAEFRQWSRDLTSMGSAANGVYLEVLQDPLAGSLEITRVLSLLGRQKGDRSPFIPLAVRLLQHKEDGVRSGAASLLGKIGTADHAPALVALLSDESTTVQSYSARALAEIGTSKELDAFDRRLATKHSADYPELLEDLKQSRDQLQKRLKEAKKKE